ncbi:MAG TPA: alpha-ketoglutarate-dependent dioxygenase AlkB [Opitutaceae bacterium]|nr:alpha-ketoglutarate-dependent dioxygenase AlkB [Opitutaceae bacterium]
MDDQLDLFGATTALPDGFKFEPELISPDEERALVAAIRELPFQPFEFHGYTGKRRTVSFGWSYDFEREALAPTTPMPAFLQTLRDAAGRFAGRPAHELKQVLVTEYDVGAGIGWHRDKGVFGDVIGISLLSSCSFRLRRRFGDGWERVTVEAAPRSAYLLAGAARLEWEHSIPEVDALRYSITYRTLR